MLFQARGGARPGVQLHECCGERLGRLEARDGAEQKILDFLRADPHSENPHQVLRQRVSRSVLARVPRQAVMSLTHVPRLLPSGSGLFIALLLESHRIS